MNVIEEQTRSYGPPTVFLVVLLLSGAARAETIYKWVGNDGVVTYSQEPPARDEGRDLQRLEVETLSPEQKRAARVLLKSEEQRAESDYRQMQDALDKGDEEIRLATLALQRAESDLKAARTPLPGERLGTVGGFSRLSQAYFDRVATLEQSVAQAKKRMERAYEARDSFRY